MTRRALIFCFILLPVLAGARFECNFKLPVLSLGSDKPGADALPVWEKLLRMADILLMEPGYTQARELGTVWARYAAAFRDNERRTAELEALANEPAIINYLQNPKSSLAPVFEKEATRILDNFGNRALTSWRLRSLTGEVILAHGSKKIEGIDTSVTHREIGARFFTIPISGTGFNFSLDAEWDITRLSDFPLSQTNSEYLFLQTDHEMNVIALNSPAAIPDSAYRFISGGKFGANTHGLQHGMRIYATASADYKLIICYPFAGYTFYAIRGSLAFLLIAGLIFALLKLRAFGSATKHMLDNRSGAWLEQHYQQSLSMNEKALELTDQTLTMVSDIKDREARLVGELGKHLQHLSKSFAEQTEQILEESSRAQLRYAPAAAPTQLSKAIIRPLNKKHVHKAPQLIDADLKPEIDVHIELDLPLKDEKQMAPEEKSALISSLKRRAQEKTAVKDFIHDEKIDSYDYTPPDPIPLPDLHAHFSEAGETNTADLEYVQKFRYSGKTRVLPMAAVPQKSPTLRMREDLIREQLVVSEEE